MTIVTIHEAKTNLSRLIARVLASAGPFRLCVVGGGAGGVELALSTQYRLRELLAARGDDPGRLRYALLTRGSVILPTHNAGVRARFVRVLAERVGLKSPLQTPRDLLFDYPALRERADAGLTLPSVASELLKARVTSAVGSEFRRIVKLTAAPASVVVVPEIVPTVMPAVSSSVLDRDTSAASTPFQAVSADVAAPSTT